MHSIADYWLWLVFGAFFVPILVLDLWIGGGRDKTGVLTPRAALGWTMVWVFAALSFCFLLWQHVQGVQGSVIAHQKALEFLLGYAIEKSLSIDNMFVILMIFQFFSIPLQYQRRVLLWGVLGAIVMRFIMIFAGIWLVNSLHWILYVFALFLLWSGVKMWFATEGVVNLRESRIVQFIRRYVRVTDKLHGEKFFVARKVTPLFLALIMVEISDLIFALDSVPAVFSVTLDPFIVLTSNVFAILGLRALYFLLAHAAVRFPALKYAVAFILMLTGAKMLLAHWLVLPPGLMLLGVVGVFAVAIGWGVWRKNGTK